MSSLGEFHHHDEEVEGKKPRIIALIVIALIVGGVALYAVEIRNAEFQHRTSRTELSARHVGRPRFPSDGFRDLPVSWD